MVFSRPISKINECFIDFEDDTRAQSSMNNIFLREYQIFNTIFIRK